jgi:membrane-bound acyltransferase YfiQ involved in biofilm formation
MAFFFNLQQSIVMFTVQQSILYFLILIHGFLIVRFCVGSMFRPVYRPYSFQWLLFIAFVPYAGYYVYYRKYIAKGKQEYIANN